MVRSAVSWTPSLGSLQLKRLYRAQCHYPSSSSATGANVFIGDRVVILKDNNGGPLAERVHLYSDTCIQTGNDGRLKIGSDTHSTRCQFCVQGTNPDWLWRTNCAELRLLPSRRRVPVNWSWSNHCKQRRHHDWWRCLVRCDCVWMEYELRAVAGAGCRHPWCPGWGDRCWSACPCCEHAQQLGRQENARAKCSNPL